MDSLFKINIPKKVCEVVHRPVVTTPKITALNISDIYDYTKFPMIRPDSEDSLGNDHLLSMNNELYLLRFSYADYNYSLYRYDSATNSFGTPTIIDWSYHSGGIAFSATKIYFYAGIKQEGWSSPTNLLAEYDITTSTLTVLGAVGIPKVNVSMTYCNNKLYMWGGGEYDWDHNDLFYECDLITSAYIEKPKMPLTCSGKTAITIGTDTYWIGATYQNNTDRGVLYKYDTLTSTWHNILTTGFTNDPLQVVLDFRYQLFYFNNKLYMVTKYTGDDTEHYNQLTIFEYDPSTNIGIELYGAFSKQFVLPSGHHQFQPIAVHNEQLWFASYYGNVVVGNESISKVVVGTFSLTTMQIDILLSMPFKMEIAVACSLFECLPDDPPSMVRFKTLEDWGTEQSGGDVNTFTFTAGQTVLSDCYHYIFHPTNIATNCKNITGIQVSYKSEKSNWSEWSEVFSLQQYE